MRDRLCARVPVADDLLAHVDGDEELCRRIIGKIVQDLEVDWQASRRAPLTLVAPVFVVLVPGTYVIGPGYAKVVDAHPIYPAQGVEDRALTYVCVCFEPLAPGEVATDTSPAPSWRWP